MWAGLGAIGAAIIAALVTLAKWLWGGKQKAEGEQLGQTEAQLSGAKEELKDVQTAQQARDSVDVSINAHPDSLRQDDGFRRD